ncbi:MAG: hypothetical protein MUC68_18075 [Burkholderiaceae bacterium]|nr:hypothetical protein [Burkholderiaceae bacterium]
MPWLLRSSLLLPLLSSLRCSQLSSQRLPVVARLARPPFASRVAAPTARRGRVSGTAAAMVLLRKVSDRANRARRDDRLTPYRGTESMVHAIC